MPRIEIVGEIRMIRRHVPALRRLAQITAVLAALAAPVFAQTATPDPSGVLGLWLSEKQKVLVDIYRCEDELCGKIVWLAKPFHKTGYFKRDSKNPDPKLRDRGWCGIEVIRGLKPENDSTWRNGDFYFPKEGKTFDIDIEKKSDDQLKFRAYLGLRFLGKSEIWTRPEPSHKIGCVAAP
jgi:uncharacterized protein (DUF2147 family)